LGSFIIGPNRKRAPKCIDCGMGVAGRFQRQTKIAPRDRIVRHECGGGFKLLERVGFVTTASKRNAKTLMRRPELRLDRYRLPELDLGVLNLAVLSKRDAIVISPFRVLRTPRQALSKLSDRIRRLPTLQISAAKCALDGGIAGEQLISRSQLRQRILDLELRQQDASEIEMRSRVFRIKFQRSAVERSGLGPFLGFGSIESLGAKLVCGLRDRSGAPEK
jgi:hypothetical protein